MLYVDDIIIAGNCKNKIEEVKMSLKSRFKMKELGDLNSFLEVKITRNEKAMVLSQTAYLERMLARFNMSECKPISMPMEVKCPQNNDDLRKVEKNVPYRELVGCLLYVTQTTRPDLCYAVNFFSLFQSEPKE